MHCSTILSTLRQISCPKGFCSSHVVQLCNTVSHVTSRKIGEKSSCSSQYFLPQICPGLPPAKKKLNKCKIVKFCIAN